MRTGKVDQVNVQVYDSVYEMGKRAALAFANLVEGFLKNQSKVRCVFAAAPSQNHFLEYLVNKCDVAWARIEAFQMDEYIGLDVESPSSFSYFLKDHLFSKVPIGKFHKMDTVSMTTSELCKHYASLLEEEDIDIVVMGIGENGHIAFNDPPVANFKDPLKIKVVELDEPCRVQQVNDGAFGILKDVPTHAVTLTIPTLINTKYILCVVPGSRKSTAVFKTLTGPINETCPASILRTCPNAKLYLDMESFSLCDPSLLED